MAHRDALISKIDLSRAPRWQPLRGLRILAAGTRHDLPGATFWPRNQFSWEVVWVRAGGLDLEIDDRKFRLATGDVAIVPPAAVDRYEWTGERRVVHSFVHFDLGAVAKGWPPRDRWAGRYALAEPHLVHHVLDVLTALPLDSPNLWTIVGIPLLEIALRLLLVGPILPAAQHAELPACVERALDWMRARVTKKASDRFSLTDVARAARVDRAHLCRAFRSHLDVTPMQCARLMRLDRAIERLERSDDAIKEIAETTGFANTFHFSRCFKTTFRVTPTRYREATNSRGLQVCSRCLLRPEVQSFSRHPRSCQDRVSDSARRVMRRGRTLPYGLRGACRG